MAKRLINQHELVYTKDAGNGYHGRCKYCNAPLITDLGYCSWDDTTCVDREMGVDNIPGQVWSYLQFRGYRWDSARKVFSRATFDHTKDILTIDQAISKVEDIITPGKLGATRQ